MMLLEKEAPEKKNIKLSMGWKQYSSDCEVYLQMFILRDENVSLL